MTTLFLGLSINSFISGIHFIKIEGDRLIFSRKGAERKQLHDLYAFGVRIVEEGRAVETF